MNIRNWIVNKLDPSHTNGLSGRDLAQDYLRYGTGATPILGQVMMGEKDKYTGYMYGAVTRRANKVISLADENIKTKANKQTTESAKRSERELVHPYLKLIDESPSFDNDEFWREIQSFIDLRGQYYLFVRRGKAGNVIGEAKEFKLLRPYEITVVRDGNNLEVIGYVETRDGVYREIPPHMIIPFNAFNPLDRIKAFSMADAAIDAQFTLKELTEQVQTTARRNRKYPGVALFGGGEVTLDTEQVANFKSRMRSKSHSDEPMFAGGKAGNISWIDMQIDMRKSAIDMANEMQLNALIAVTGTSKTKFGIEQSGVTRDTADVQDDQFVADHAIPAARLILSALNQDYKNSYPKDYAKYGYKLYVKSPLGDDKDTELKSVRIRKESFSLYQSMRAKGYSDDVSARYANGNMELTEIGEPTEEPTPLVDGKPPGQDGSAGIEEEEDDSDDDQRPPAAGASNNHDHTHDLLPVIRNETSEDDRAAIAQQEAALLGAIVGVQAQIVEAALTNVPRLTYETQDVIITEEQEQAAVAALIAALVAFYAALLAVQGLVVMARRVLEFSLTGSFEMDEEVNQYIEATARLAAESHVSTVLDDIRKSVRETVENLVQEERQRIADDPQTGDPTEKDEIYAFARRKAFEGVGQERIVRAIRDKFGEDISKTRAKTIARTESRRIYNRAQFDADRQFLTQNELMTRAYKKYVNRGPDPCPFCKMLAARPPIPFMQPFAKLGEVLTATFTKADGSMSVRTMKVGFEDAMSGEIHPNGWCGYQLIIM